MFENLLAYSPNTLQKCTSIFDQNKILEIQIGRSGLKNISRYCPFKAGGGGGAGQWLEITVTLRGDSSGGQGSIFDMFHNGRGVGRIWALYQLGVWVNLYMESSCSTPTLHPPLPLHTFSPFTYSRPSIWVKDTVRRSYPKHNTVLCRRV
jgi:hypothetical protein